MTKITIRPGGPILIDGDVTLLDGSGADIPVDRQPVALCRCGASGNKPFCDGSHKGVDFDRARPVTR